MTGDETRRTLLSRAGLVALGVAVGKGVNANASPASPEARVAMITGVQGGAVEIEGAPGWLPVEGFPEGWQPLVGDEVAVAPSLAGDHLSAQPLVHWVTTAASPADLLPTSSVGGAGGPEVVAATVLEPDLSDRRQRGDRAPTPLKAAVGARASSGGGERIVAIREA